MTGVRWVGDYGVIFTYCEEGDDEYAIEFTRQQLIDWHNLDPYTHGFSPEILDET